MKVFEKYLIKIKSKSFNADKSKKTKEVLVFYFKVLAEPYVNGRKLKLQGLNPEQKYLVNDKEELYGDKLMNIGLDIKNEFGDFRASFWRIKMI